MVIDAKLTIVPGESFGRYDKAAVQLPCERGHRCFDLSRVVDKGRDRFDRERGGSGLESAHVKYSPWRRCIRIHHEHDACNGGRNLLQRRQPLAHDRRLVLPSATMNSRLAMSIGIRPHHGWITTDAISRQYHASRWRSVRTSQLLTRRNARLWPRVGSAQCGDKLEDKPKPQTVELGCDSFFG